MKKVIFLLNIGDYAPQITELTYPLIRYYADKIGAEIYIIKERRYPEWPVTYEKLQIYDLARELNVDWAFYIDSDVVVHPEMFDPTLYMTKDTVMHNGFDFASLRWTFDKYFWRDGRSIGSCNWFTIASSWCLDLWHPLDISLNEALRNIHPTVDELNTVITKEHLIDDYALSRNIARYGLKFKTFRKLLEELEFKSSWFLWHEYVRTTEEKINGWQGPVWDEEKKMNVIVPINGIKGMLDQWRIPKCVRDYGK